MAIIYPKWNPCVWPIGEVRSLFFLSYQDSEYIDLGGGQLTVSPPSGYKVADFSFSPLFENVGEIKFTLIGFDIQYPDPANLFIFDDAGRVWFFGIIFALKKRVSGNNTIFEGFAISMPQQFNKT